MADGIEKIENEAELAQVRQQAKKVQGKATAVGLLLWLLALLL